MRLTKPSREAYLLGPLLLDADRLSISHQGRNVAAPPLVVEVLIALCRHAGSFVSKEQLAEQLWPQGYADDSTLWQKIYLARKLLEPYCGKGAIETLPRRGYRLAIPVARAEARAAAYPRRATIAAAAIVAASIIVLAPWRSPSTALPADAQRAYNLGSYFERAGTVDGDRKAITQFQHAIALAPAHAAGYAGLAQAYAVFSDESERNRGFYLREASRDAARALALDPRSAPAETALGEIALMAGENGSAASLRAALRSARAFAVRAVTFDDAFAPAHLLLGESAFIAGDRSAGARELGRALDLDPSLAVANVLMGRLAYARGDYLTATEYSNRALFLGTSDQEDALLTLGLAETAQHRFLPALRAFGRLITYSRGVGFSARAYAEARSGQVSGARRDLRIAERDGGCDCAKFWLNVAFAKLALGDRAGGLDGLRKARSKADYVVARFDPRLTTLPPERT